MTINIFAFLWGLAEATLFFIVPDVGLSIMSLNGIEVGLIACLYALAGALVGGTIMYYWGQADSERVTRILTSIPAIRIKDIEKVRSDLEKSGITAILFGPILGIPYKIYAANAHLRTSYLHFLLISIPARIVRFVLVAVVTPLIIHRFFPHISYLLQVLAIFIFWFFLYLLYFAIKRK
jgi:membrane protein YqaA with SNARE-associated domain